MSELHSHSHTHNHSDAHKSQDTVKQMIEIMSQSGWRITEQRRELAEIFAKTEGYLSPKDVYDHMSRAYPSVSFDTVYRNLRLLSEMGALEQFYFMDGGLKFRVSCLSHHHHHLICINCEKTLTFEYCPMDQPLDLPGSFKIMNHRFEVYGVCEVCQRESGA
ncbi:Fur family transcriptional regulator [Paenibacillus sp. CF384]|uniref:Fur family transcriptional regulator n=1 Tax=Paenibacillus sp. CF384 TaxID=1884382 RepID=UPI00089B8666|nr:Fur family transcriptional regulator [Paenibacillus sp. CF384]SDW29131.1 Fur family transcriptional regulator, zinc uptake regulator [Paenibacillus sp. CF384]